jgi:hypothetical protein
MTRPRQILAVAPREPVRRRQDGRIDGDRVVRLGQRRRRKRLGGRRRRLLERAARHEHQCKPGSGDGDLTCVGILVALDRLDAGRSLESTVGLEESAECL